MSQNDRGRCIELFKGFVYQVGLRFRGPECAAGSLTVAISRPVKNDNPILFGGLVEEAARLKS